ncbi:mercuric transport protein (Mercury ion transport protein) [Azoarcus sp. CIB]|nr:mercuric transport protein (Mercury ion transport protein) [Azoarcus sp. CIB]
MHPKSSIENLPRRDGRGSLLTGGVAAILASACCVGPLALLALGFSGAWIGTPTAPEPWSWIPKRSNTCWHN